MPVKKINISVLLPCLLLLISSQISAQDISGKWQGIFHTDMGWKPRDFFLTMVLNQDKKKIKGVCSNADLDLSQKPNVIYEIFGFIGKRDTIPATMRVGSILLNNLAPGVAEAFLEFENIRYFKNDTAELLYGRWVPNGPGPGGYFWARKILSPDSVQQQKIAQKNTTDVRSPDTVAMKNNEQSLATAMQGRNKMEQGRFQLDTNIITLSLFDNGIVDEDTISVFFNGKLLIDQQRVSDKVLSLNLELKESKNEIILFANNVGRIPPNTVLLTLTAGSKFYQLILNANMNDNAVLVMEYIPKGIKKPVP